MTDYLELSTLFQKEIAKRQEREKACSRLVRQFALGFIEQYKWPANQVAFMPSEGNPNIKELAQGFPAQDGPSQAMHYADGLCQVRLGLQILPPSVSPPNQLYSWMQGVRYFRVYTPITMRVEDAFITLKVGNIEHKVSPTNVAADLLPVYESFFKNLTEYMQHLSDGQKPNKFGFHVSN